MKLVHRSLEKDGAGEITMVPEESEDMWHAFNLIQEGDAVRASTVRKVVSESATGSRSADKVRTTLTVQVETIDFDTQVSFISRHVNASYYHHQSHGETKSGHHTGRDVETQRSKYRGEPAR